MLPSSCPQNHAANILPLPDGALMCVWFAGTQGRYCRYFCLGIAIARWRNAVERCGKLSHDDTRSGKTRCCFSRRITCCGLWTAQISGNQDTAIVRYRKSDDLGQTWARLPPCLINPVRSFDSQSRCLITATGCCRLLLPYPTRRKMGRQ